MALESYLGPNYLIQSQVQQGSVQSSSSTILQQDGNISRSGGSSLSGSPGVLSHSVAQTPDQNSPSLLGDLMVSRPYATISAMSNDSSLITESNSPISGRSSMSNAVNHSGDSILSNYVRLPGPSAGNDLPTQQQIYQGNQASAWCFKRQGEALGNTVPLSQLTMPTHQVVGPSVMNTKKPRLEIKLDDSPFPHSVWLQLRNQNPMQSYNPEIATITLQHHLAQNHPEIQTSLSCCSPQRPCLQPVPPLPPSRDVQRQQVENVALSGAMCIRRLMTFMGHQRQRPPDNNFVFWRQFVEEYYSPCAKKRWCLSNYDNVGRHAQGVFSDPLMDCWNCDLCGSKSRKGFEATYEVLPRLNKIYFDSGIIDEILYIDFPREQNLSSGFMLTFGKAVQESVYKDFRVSHEGQLRIIFSRELKITSWEFCVKSHDEFIPRNLVAAQVNEFFENVARCHGNIDSKGTEEVPRRDVLTYCNKLAAAGSSLARKTELPLVNDLGFSKQLVRSLQISEVLNCMKDLMGYSQRNNISPTESLKRYSQEHAYAKFINNLAERRAYMQQFQVPDRTNLIDPSVIGNIYNLHVPNLMHQTPIIGREPAIPSMNYYQKPMLDQPNVHQSFNTRASFHPVSNESKVDDTTQVINNLLEILHWEQNQEEHQNKKAKGKTRVVYDPNVDGSQSMLGGMRVQAPNPRHSILGGVVEKGNGSGSSSRTFPSHDFPKTEPVSEEEFASTSAAYPRFFENGHR